VFGDTNTFTFTGTDHTNCAHWSKVITWPSTGRQTDVSTTGTPPLDVIGVRLILIESWMTQFPPMAATTPSMKTRSSAWNRRHSHELAFGTRPNQRRQGGQL